MNNWLKKIAVFALAGATALTLFSPSAEADWRHGHGHWGGHGGGGWGWGGGAVAGVAIGTLAGALIATSASANGAKTKRIEKVENYQRTDTTITERVVEKPVYIERIVEKPVDRIVEVPGPERVQIVEKEVPGPERVVTKEVPGPERIVEKPVEKIIYVDRPAQSKVAGSRQTRRPAH